MGEAHIGDVATVAIVFMAWCLRFWTGVLEQVDFTEVVSHRHHLLIMGATKGVDVCAVRAF